MRLFSSSFPAVVEGVSSISPNRQIINDRIFGHEQQQEIEKLLSRHFQMLMGILFVVLMAYNAAYEVTKNTVDILH